MSRAFHSLAGYNYRTWACGALVSNIGTWMQRVAQDWVVLTQLTRHNATAVGVVMALQFGPQVLLLPWTGFAADHWDRRKLLFATQAAMAALALAQGLLLLGGRVLAIMLATALGGTTFGGPMVGWVADRLGPRWALAVGASSGFAAALVGLHHLARHRHVRLHCQAGRLRFTCDPAVSEVG